MKHAETLLQTVILHEKSKFQKNRFVTEALVDFYVPFLPLERKHVKKCIRDYAQVKYNVITDDKFLEKVADQLQYDPPDAQLYSKTGCKRVHKKVDYFLTDD